MEHIAAAVQWVGTADDCETVYTWDGTRWPTRQAAIAHGLDTFGHDDFNIAGLIGDEVVWKGWMDEEHPDEEDRRTLARSLGLSWRETPGGTS